MSFSSTPGPMRTPMLLLGWLLVVVCACAAATTASATPPRKATTPNRFAEGNMIGVSEEPGVRGYFTKPDRTERRAPQPHRESASARHAVTETKGPILHRRHNFLSLIASGTRGAAVCFRTTHPS